MVTTVTDLMTGPPSSELLARAKDSFSLVERERLIVRLVQADRWDQDRIVYDALRDRAFDLAMGDLVAAGEPLGPRRDLAVGDRVTWRP